jgi:hypothetical protein
MGAGEAKDANPGAARLLGIHPRDAESFALSIIFLLGRDRNDCGSSARDRFRAIVFAILDVRSSPDQPLGDAVETFIRREDAERLTEEVRGGRSRARELLADRRAGAPWGTSQVSAEIPS